MNSEFKMLFAAMMRRPVSRRGADLDQGVHGHAVDAGEHGQQEQVGHQPPVGMLSATNASKTSTTGKVRQVLHAK